MIVLVRKRKNRQIVIRFQAYKKNCIIAKLFQFKYIHFIVAIAIVIDAFLAKIAIICKVWLLVFFQTALPFKSWQIASMHIH